MPITQMKVSLKDYVQVIFRRRWLFIIPFITVFATATLGSFLLPRVYHSYTTILVTEERIISPLIGDLAVSTAVKERLNALTEEILSWNSLVELVKKVGLAEKVKSQPEFENLLLGIRKKVKVDMKGHDIIQISYLGENPRQVQQVAAVLTNIFIERNIQSITEEASSAIQFIENQLAIYKKKLEGSERALKEFKEKYQAELPGELNVNLGRLVDFQSELLKVNLDLEDAMRTKRLLERQLSGEEQIVIAEVTRIQNPLVAQLTEHLVGLKMQLNTLMVDARETHPLVQELRREIDDIETQITLEKEKTISEETSALNPVYQELEQQFRTVELKIDSLESRQQALKALEEDYQARVQSIPAQEQQLAELTRDTRVNEGIYSMLLQRLEAAKISQRLETSEKGTKFKVLNEARLSLKPIKPNKIKISFLGLFVGTLLGFAAVFVREFTDHSISSIEDAKVLLDLPVLASIPRIFTPREIQSQRLKQGLLLTVVGLIFFAIIVVVILSKILT
ncbi:MAG: XrtA system polysaccharide chain length determinant [Candidatus Ratteibacteria bacterium]|nr:XrtA system polysaccharide chain length determinant [Candidatus Ratteibacteria bacterium]